jgi:HD-GYP domain-containing protein (c-di-GMP phosphodiesterase class II)
MVLLFLTGALGRLENQAQDRLYRDFILTDPDIVVFGIDEETLIEFGPFQSWTRRRMADAISILNSDPEWKPAVIAVDILYAGESNDPEADQALVRAAEEGGNVIFGAMASFDSYGDVKTFEKSFGALDRVSGYGLVNAYTDPDGIVRRAEFGVTIDGLPVPTFPEAVYSMFTGGEVSVPARFSSPLRLAFSSGPGGYYGDVGLGTSFRDIFDESFEPAFYADTIVLIGPYASGLLDSYFTAADYGSKMHGIEIHANIVQMFLDENFKGTAPLWVSLTVLILTLIVFSVIFMRFDIRVSAAVLAVFAVGYVLLNLLIYKGGWAFTLLYPPVSAAALFIFSLVYNYISDKIAFLTEIAEINKRHLTEVRELFDSFVRVMTDAIDARTPYNANHTVNVAEYTQQFVRHLRGLYEPGSPYHMDDNREEQLVMAAFLHDVGKIVTPIEVMDKPSRLGSRLVSVLQRFEVKKLYDKVMFLSGAMSKEDYEKQVEHLNDTIAFIERINTAGFLPDEDLARVASLSEIVYTDSGGTAVPVFGGGDIESLSVRKGTLTDAERDIMQEHVSITERLLDKMKFSDRLEHVKIWASSHHEFIDGTGYPHHAAHEQLPTEVRILTMMDIYDALTAKDRPYKKATPHAVAIKILRSMVEEGKLDKEIVELFAESGIGDTI